MLVREDGQAGQMPHAAALHAPQPLPCHIACVRYPCQDSMMVTRPDLDSYCLITAEICTTVHLGLLYSKVWFQSMARHMQAAMGQACDGRCIYEWGRGRYMGCGGGLG